MHLCPSPVFVVAFRFRRVFIVAFGVCNSYDKADPRLYLSTKYEEEVLFTYDVMWDQTTMPWTQRYASVGNYQVGALAASVSRDYTAVSAVSILDRISILAVYWVEPLRVSTCLGSSESIASAVGVK